MKKLLLVTIIASMLALPGLVLAQNSNTGGGFQTGAAQSGAGGFTGPSAGATTVAEALTMRDDAYVTLTGKIEKQLGHEKYQFNDGTGVITLDIDDDDWGGLTVGPQDQVEIYGEIDKDFTSIEVEVKRIVKK